MHDLVHVFNNHTNFLPDLVNFTKIYNFKYLQVQQFDATVILKGSQGH